MLPLDCIPKMAPNLTASRDIQIEANGTTNGTIDSQDIKNAKRNGNVSVAEIFRFVPYGVL